MSTILTPYWAIVDSNTNDSPSIHLPKRVINPLALILHELATNALKHGAWSPDGHGNIIIDWRLKPSESRVKTLELNWRETLEGTEMPSETCRAETSDAGFGSKLIDMSVTQLDGKLTRKWDATGLSLCLSFIIDEQAV